MGGQGSGPHKYGSNSHVENMADNHPARQIPYPEKRQLKSDTELSGANVKPKEFYVNKFKNEKYRNK